MSKLENLKQRFQAEVDAAKALQPKAENGTLSADETTAFKNHIKNARDLKTAIEQEKADNDVRSGLAALTAELNGSGNGVKAIPGNAKVRASGGTGEWAKAVTDYSERFGMKSILANGAVPVQVPMDTEPIPLNSPVLSLRQLIPAVADTTGVWKYIQQTVRTNNASTVAQGKKKPTSVYTYDDKEGRAVVIAHLSESMPRQIFDDAPALQEALESEMRLGLELELEDQIINGAGSTTGVLDDMVGIGNTSGIQTLARTSGDDEFIVTRKAITLLEKSAIAPTGWVMSADAWESFELSADANDRFMLGNAPVDRAARRLWGVPVVLSEAVADTTVYLADFANATRLHVRQEGRLDWSENHYAADKFGASAPGSDFEGNMIKWRFEGRFGLDVLRPFSIVEVDLTPAA
ncbi:phage major capsid protein [Actinomadura montaniterrae]|uniref:phage major capsid protein n=1 Tax=Actinomadura montaniterrae TaxID=1803903 RepID=UPI00178C2BD8|nr:phage major capsid protein [Actinomadura montaniterrae]